MELKPDLKPIIIPIAAGKGGVGKTFLAANLAIAFAELKKKTIVLDLDLGGSNLYSWLNARNIHPGIGDFLFSGKKPLEEFIVKDLREYLSYIPGDGQSAGLANIKHLQKQKIIRAISSLEADFILLDLSAGTTFNTLDFFNLSNNGLIVTIPEMTSVMNVLGFFKNFLLRAMSKEFAKNVDAMEILNSFRKRSIGKESIRFSELIKKIEELDSGAGAKAREICKYYAPRIVFNMGISRDNLSFGKRLKEILNEYLMLDIEFIGFIYWNSDVIKSVYNGTRFLEQFPDSPATVSIKKIADRLIKYGNSRIENSFEKLYNSVNEK
tara:strand:+ start:3021 stop:3992 length:972 start_codon:yes stop_codon:yes gene_type:complete